MGRRFISMHVPQKQLVPLWVKDAMVFREWEYIISSASEEDKVWGVVLGLADRIKVNGPDSIDLHFKHSVKLEEKKVVVIQCGEDDDAAQG